MTYRNDASPVTASFGRRARELRGERGWTLKEAAALASLTPGTLCRIERGADTTLGTAARVAGAYGVRLAVMLDPDSCPVCHDAPRRGFACQSCGTKGPEVFPRRGGVTAGSVTTPERKDRPGGNEGEPIAMSSTTGPVTEQEIRETPVTGMSGRTPREAIEKPMTDRELEVIEIIDVSGSNAEQAAPDSPMTKQELITGAQPHLVAALEGDDSQAAREQSGGSSAKGGVRVFYANEPQPIEFEAGEDESDDPRDGGDHNTANVQEKLAAIPWGGRTYLMPAIKAAEAAYQAEFGDVPLRKRPAMEVLIVTDGKLNDPGPFEEWLAQADELCVVAVAVIGYGRGHDEAVEHYQALARKNKFLTCAALTGVSNPAEIALDLRLLSGTAPSS